MGAVAVIGAPSSTDGYALGGARVFPAVSAEEIRRAWDGLTADTALVILTAAAAESLGAQLDAAVFLTVVMPV